MATATARHILVETQQECEDIKKQIEAGADFAELAMAHSKCPSGREGGALGEFSPGQMVKEFDEVVFSGDTDKIHGPVQTQFGFHLIEVIETKKEPKQLFEKVKEKLIQKEYQIKFNQLLTKYIEGLKNKATITYR